MTPLRLDVLAIRKRLGRHAWKPPQPVDLYRWRFETVERHPRGGPAGDVLVSSFELDDGPWVHASIGHPDSMPSYDDLVMLHAAVFPNGWAYQVFAPPSSHVNIHPFALHLWGRPNGSALMPDFGAALGGGI